jgi:PadR family transcriptional regulator, regulatory protein PadR
MARSRNDLLQGTLDLLILKTLALGPQHGWAISQRIQQISEDALRVNQGSLYPALHRLEEQGSVESEWGTSESNREAKFYKLTRAGAKQLEAETANWARVSVGIAKILKSTT